MKNLKKDLHGCTHVQDVDSVGLFLDLCHILLDSITITEVHLMENNFRRDVFAGFCAEVGDCLLVLSCIVGCDDNLAMLCLKSSMQKAALFPISIIPFSLR